MTAQDVKNVLLLLTIIFSKKYFHFPTSDKICPGNGTCTGNGICNGQAGLCDCFTGFYGLGCESKWWIKNSFKIFLISFKVRGHP